ncbi:MULTISPECIES: flagellar basal body P-ring formation chaperone FlgA [Pseudovibrio]|uniref:flagellar basal body P-ring formation chaperone FlgA n=1 Tax=Stappiaceae TaxID=2821832 RepID=UPI0023672348|nr:MULTISPECIES: flagellar basal body P-ring formation chaperone FlgA [Pseudovibrio]MDD7909016.1 flagellar basal body P-ring formation chaperone FlgA [Pseudovibrio exalbescens]MDX5593663.1 flagellar basal body P-ring formation chaperone FlgA [Pseudovibrio sp. SPO723]
MKEKRSILGATALVLAGLFSSFAHASDRGTTELPTPSMVIYPGDIISEGMLQDKVFLNRGVAEMAVVLNAEDAIGKEVRRTLVPGQPMPLNALQEPLVVKRGTLTNLVFRENGLEIRAVVEPLQSGAEGELIKARNVDTGQQVTGVVQLNGTLLIKGD